MAVKKKVESTTTKRVKNYGKEYIQNIKLDVENATLSLGQSSRVVFSTLFHVLPID